MKELDFKAFDQWGKGYKSRLDFVQANIRDVDESLAELNALISSCHRKYNAMAEDENCCPYATGFLVAIEDFFNDNFPWWESGKIPHTMDGYWSACLILNLYRQLNASSLFSVNAGVVLNEFGKTFYGNYSNLDERTQAYYWKLMDELDTTVIDTLLKMVITKNVTLVDSILSFVEKVNKQMEQLEEDMSNMKISGDCVIFKTEPWIRR